ncbi:MAG TPA: TetR/AcrR family transcriptional regulator [Taishania sp.]|nr:TetR/AcrR family transcriptional regulator [Taishania sp.]
MSNQLTDTELLIISKTKELVYNEGKIKPTSQEIADFCGVQRTLVNYYFRSKENLTRIVQEEITSELHEGLNEIYGAQNVTFEQKVDALIDFMFNFKRKYSYFEVYSINISTKLFDEEVYIKPEPTKMLCDFMQEINQEMEKGTILKSDPINFLINIFSLVSYPLVMKGIYQDVFGVTAEEFDQLLINRKNIIKNLIFNK